ncbi:MAG: hypothetical protein PF637_06020 [Spirochaetes bacterium]|jgi:hypothetical protein|nr:hypothetical protein [Spirochaetota bacterium]
MLSMTHSVNDLKFELIDELEYFEPEHLEAVISRCFEEARCNYILQHINESRYNSIAALDKDGITSKEDMQIYYAEINYACHRLITRSIRTELNGISSLSVEGYSVSKELSSIKSKSTEFYNEAKRMLELAGITTTCRFGRL